MKRIIMTIVLGITLPVSVSAAQIYGTLTEGGRSLPAKVEFEVTCKDQTYKGYTDNYGAYSVNVAARGRCVFKLNYKGQTPTSFVYSSGNLLRYDFELVMLNGTYELRRK